MKNIILFAISMILFAQQGKAQADCYFKYCYIAEVELTSDPIEGDSILIHLPSPELMLKIVDSSRGYFIEALTPQLQTKIELQTIGSSVFCGPPDHLIKNILIGKNSNYVIHITKGKTRYKQVIRIEQIKFYHKNGMIFIELPTIKI